MILKKKTSNKMETIKIEINSKLKEIESLKSQVSELRTELLSLEILPFKIGDYALAEVQIGRTKKECKCLLECVNGILYLRPVKNNGKPSQKHFSCTPISKSYSEILKKVEE